MTPTDRDALAEALERAAEHYATEARSRERQAMTYAIGLSPEAAVFRRLQAESERSAEVLSALARAVRDGRVNITEDTNG